MRSRGSRSRTARTLTRLAVFGASLLAAAGCAAVLGFEETTLRSDVDREGGLEDGPILDPDGNVILADGAASRLTTTPSSVIVRRGGSADIAVEVARGSDVTGSVIARLTNLPGGVTATAATLEPPATTGKVTLTAAKTAALGAKTINLVADGTSLPPATIPLLVADAPGTLDTTFDADGFVTDLSMGLGATYFALGLQTDGRIVAGGAGGPPGGPLGGWILRRYAPNGVPDTAFSAATIGLPDDGELQAIAIDAGGKIVCVGSSSLGAVPPLLLTVVRLLPSGAVDTTFGGATGTIRLPVTEAPTGGIGLGVAVQADGAVVVVGARRDALGVEDGVIARFRTNGTRDVAFNGGATVVIPDSRLVGVSIDPAGPIVAAGSTIRGLGSYIVARRTAQGAADPTFGTGGVITFGNTYRGNASTRLVDGSIIMVGDVQPTPTAYTAGALSDKGVSLFAPHAFAAGTNAGFFGVAPQDSKRFIAAGHTAVVNGEARVERISIDGTKDLSFGASGTAIIEPAGIANGFDVTLFSAAVQADARILVAGNRSNAGAVVYRLWQ